MTDNLFPDPLSYSFDNFSSMRLSIASLVIVFPLHLVVSYFLNKDLREHPEKRGIWIRKWLTFVTLFVAGVTIITDLVFLINTFLGGEITIRFLLKVLSILVVAGAIFGYYVYELRRDVAVRSAAGKIFMIISSVVVLAALVGGFLLMGSPSTQRKQRFDERRVSDLQNIQYQVINFYQRKGSLPNNLDELKDPLSGFGIIPNDPETGSSYEYEKTGDLKFRLCAMFSLESRNGQNDSYAKAPIFDRRINDDWQHESGRQCFDREIDPELYPAIKDKERIQ